MTAFKTARTDARGRAGIDLGDGSQFIFTDRREAGRQLARRLSHLRSANVVVVGLPRGGLPVAAEVARELRAPLDVIVVRKLGVPFQPEFAMGAIGEGGARAISADVLAEAGLSPEDLGRVEARERVELQRRVELFRAAHERVPLTGRVVVIVDDGVATGSTARAACLVAWAQGAARVVLAVPVAPQGWEQRFAGVADELVCVSAPRHLLAISCCYAHFPQVRDEEALACLTGSASPTHSSLAHSSPTQGPNSSRDSDCPDAAVDPRDGEVEVAAGAGAVALPGRLTVPVGGVRGVVVFAHGSGSSRHSPRNRQVAQLLNGAGLATLLFDLLTPAEGGSRANVFDVALLAERLAAATRWLRAEPGLAGLPVGWFGASTGAAAALWAAAEPDCQVAAVVSRGGRPDLAGSRLSLVRAPTLLIVGGSDDVVLRLNRQALARMRCQARMAVVPGATHLFEEPGTLEAAAQTARAWFLAHLTRTAPPARPGPALSGQPAAAGGSAGTGLAGGSAGTAAGGGSAGT